MWNLLIERGDAVEGEQRAVQVRPAVSEDAPGVAVATSRLEIERGHEDRLAVPTCLGDLAPVWSAMNDDP